LEYDDVSGVVGEIFWIIRWSARFILLEWSARFILLCSIGMRADIKIIDLKEKEDFLDQYIHLRNKYVECLLTSPVTLSETKEWLKKSDIEVRGLVQDNVLVGVVILYLNRGGEIAFFVKEPNKGIGSQLLQIIQPVAKKKGLKSVWAWVLDENSIAQRTFEKNGFVKRGLSQRKDKGSMKQGIEYMLGLDS